jgi:DNA invertase Pin-like site-specific DNA recombinase
VSGFPAAQYVRMSTDQQRFSLDNQKAVIAAYARDHGYEIIQTYEDPGRSGLTMKGRPGLQRLIADVRAGRVAFRTILVLDVSRWGRFQDVDQAAHYEYICREAGVAVLYCTEAFPNDHSAMASIMKHMKRVMAAEYSRELSTKVARAQRHQARLGFKQGGTMPLGVRGLVVDPSGEARFVIARGQRKACRDDRITFTRGPKAEVALVNRIFQLYADEGLRLAAIVAWLNGSKKRHPHSHRWTSESVRNVLTNEIYAGRYVFGRNLSNLGHRVRAPEAAHIRVDVIDPLVPEELFQRAQVRLDATTRRYYSTEELIVGMTRLLEERGKLTFALVSDCPYLPKPITLVKRFGSLPEAYRAAGYEPPDRWKKNANGVRYSDEDLLNELRRIHGTQGCLSCKIIAADRQSPRPGYFIRRFGSLEAACRLAGFVPVSASFRQDTVDRQRELARVLPGARRQNRNRNPDGTELSDEQLLEILRRLWKQFGYITLEIINRDRRSPNGGYFSDRFGSILKAYKRSGYASTLGQLAAEAHKRRAAPAR